jgi:putative transposase
VTYQRKNILIKNRDLILQFINNSIEKYDIDFMAWVILPDHIHFIADFKKHNMSNIIQKMKMSFASNYRKRAGMEFGRVWQNRFWDHIIRDENDLKLHLDYIHYNPVKHGLTRQPFDWQYSSIHAFKDFYNSDWGVMEKMNFNGEFGE